MKFLFTPLLGVTLAAVLAVPASARVTELNIAAVEPFAEGSIFGAAGTYERVRGNGKPIVRVIRDERISGTPNPVRNIKATPGFGVSQSGRFLLKEDAERLVAKAKNPDIKKMMK